jgi:hypothetical protein
MADDEFKSAMELWKEDERIKTPKQIGSMINELWAQLGSIIVICPYCKKKMAVQTTKNKKCWNCERIFAVYPKDGRTTNIDPASVKNVSILQNIRSLEQKGRFEVVW